MDFCVAKPFSSILYVSAAAGRALDWNGEFFIHDMLNAQYRPKSSYSTQ